MYMKQNPNSKAVVTVCTVNSCLFGHPAIYGHPDNTFAFANFALPGGRAFANLRANPKLLTRTQFPIRL